MFDAFILTLKKWEASKRDMKQEDALNVQNQDDEVQRIRKYGFDMTIEYNAKKAVDFIEQKVCTSPNFEKEFFEFKAGSYICEFIVQRLSWRENKPYLITISVDVPDTNWMRSMDLDRFDSIDEMIEYVKNPDTTNRIVVYIVDLIKGID